MQLSKPIEHSPQKYRKLAPFRSIEIKNPTKSAFFCVVTQWEESFFPKTSVAIVILFWLKWAGYLAVAGLNLLAQLSDRISPYGV